MTHIGLLLRADSDGGIGQEVVGGRVLYHEKVRDALLRHIESDLGPWPCHESPCRPSLSPSPSSSRHRVSRRSTTLASTPSRSPSLSPSWATAARRRTPSTFLATPEEAAAIALGPEMSGSHGVLVRQALAGVELPL